MQPLSPKGITTRRLAVVAFVALFGGVFVVVTYWRPILNTSLNSRPPAVFGGRVVAESTYTPLPDARVRVEARTTGVTWENKFGFSANAVYETDVDSNGHFRVEVRDPHSVVHLYVSASGRATVYRFNPPVSDSIVAVLARLPKDRSGITNGWMRVRPLSAAAPGGWNFKCGCSVSMRDSADVWFSWDEAGARLRVAGRKDGGVIYLDSHDLGNAIDPQAAICQAPRWGYHDVIELSVSTIQGVIIVDIPDGRTAKLNWEGDQTYRLIAEGKGFQALFTYNRTDSRGLCFEGHF